MSPLLLAILLGASPSVEVQTLDGRAIVGALVDLNAERVLVETSEGRKSIDVAKLLSIAPGKKSAASPPSGFVVELMDGSAIAARQYLVQGSDAQITPTNGEAIKIAMRLVRSVRLQRESAAMFEEWQRLLKMKADSDLLVARKGDVIDYHKGVLHDVTEDAVRFEVDGDILPVKRSKIYGLAYRHGDAKDLPAAECRVTDAAGSQWSARGLAGGEKLQWTTPSGVTISQPLESIVQIDFSRGKVVYLSDLKPDSVRWAPYFGGGEPPAVLAQFYGPRFDRAFESNSLQLGGASYRKGLAIHSRTELVYRLPDRFSRFLALAGIDDAVRPAGEVRLRVQGDDKELLNVVIAGRDSPRPVDLDLIGVRRLTITVDFVDANVVGDHLLLCNARLTK